MSETDKVIKRVPYQRLDDEDETVETTQETDPENQEDIQTPDPDPKTVEEKTFKKRYGDLRRFHDVEMKKIKIEVDALNSKLSDKNKSLKLPKTPEEIEAWRLQYPEVFDIVKTISRGEAIQEKEELDIKINDLVKREQELAYERAFQKLVQKHPDFEEIKETEDFHTWLSEQTSEIQAWLYDNDNDWIKASRAVDLYKHDRNIAHVNKDNKKKDQVEGSKLVKVKGAKEPDLKDKPVYKLSDIERMSTKEFEAKEADIELARKEGRLINDK